MKMLWSDVVDVVFEKLEDLMTVCPSCSSNTTCVDKLSRLPPIEIQVLGECCACILENALESIQTIDRIYGRTELGEDVAIYKLDDVIIEVSSTSAIIVPISQLENYLELVKDFSHTVYEAIRGWLGKNL